jgi:FixJ family two-component response regulator
MPGMSGIDLRVARARPVAGVPIVLVTGDADAMESVLASGAVALLKPYSTERLRDVLDEALEARR